MCRRGATAYATGLLELILDEGVEEIRELLGEVEVGLSEPVGELDADVDDVGNAGVGLNLLDG